ncbi:hypothetical protein IFR05_009796 [Cadophora sp. M221]|nr:hypothetical protein IFR05_009796 [Cadophora sp. M221]
MNGGLNISINDAASEATVNMPADSTDKYMTTFHPFPRLPLELRRKIFDHAVLLFGRIIEVEPIYYAKSATSITALDDAYHALQCIRIRASSGPTLLIEIGDATSLTINWRLDQLFMNTKNQFLWFEATPGIHMALATSANLFKPFAHIFSPEGYIDMQKNMRCLAGTWRGWLDTKHVGRITRVVYSMFVGFTGLEEIFLVHAAKDDVSPPRPDVLASRIPAPVRAISRGTSLSPEG